MVEMGCSVFFQGLTQPLGASYAGSRFGADAEAWDIKVKVVLYSRWEIEGVKVTGHIKPLFFQYDFSVDNEMQSVWNLTPV